MKKKNIILSICCILAVILIIIGNVYRKDNKNIDKNKIVTSFYPMYIATLNIIDGIDDIELVNLTNNSVGCVHDYTLTPQEMMNLSDADALIVNGSGMENFLEDVFNNYNGLKIIDSSVNVVTIDGHHEKNPHTFVSISNYIVQVKNISKGLRIIYPEYVEKINENTSKYLQELETLNDYANEEISKLKNKRVVALHESFEYFAKDFGIDVREIIEEEEGTTASAAQIAETIDKIKTENIKVIVVEKDSAQNTPKTIAKETGIKTCEFNISISGDEEKAQYIKDMTKNIQNLVEILSEVE